MNAMFPNYPHRYNGSEDVFVKKFIKLIAHQKLYFGKRGLKGKFHEQISIPSIRRTSDLIIYTKTNDRLINIEFKLKDHKCLMKQATDHLKWCDYSYVCVPASLYINYPKNYSQRLRDKGIGLILGNAETFMEIFRAKYNSYKGGKNKEIRNFVKNKL